MRLVADLELKGRKGELAYRVRGVQEIPGHGFEERRVDEGTDCDALMQQVDEGVVALDGDRHGTRPCSNRAGRVERSRPCGGLDEAGSFEHRS